MSFESTDPSPITSDKTDIDDSGAEDDENAGPHKGEEVAEDGEEKQGNEESADAPAPNLERPLEARQPSEKTVRNPCRTSFASLPLNMRAPPCFQKCIPRLQPLPTDQVDLYR